MTVDLQQAALRVDPRLSHFDYVESAGDAHYYPRAGSGPGRLILSTPYLLENLGNHPAADRLPINLVRYVATPA